MQNKFKRTTNLGVVLLGFYTKNYVHSQLVLCHLDVTTINLYWTVLS